MSNDVFRKNKDGAFYFVLGVIGLVVMVGLGAAYYMEHHGHIVTGMTNQVVWGLPHVFAIFLIVAASGALNVASIGSVFGKPMYKARAPLSGLLAIAMLAGGLMVLMLDLGRADRLIIAMTYLNFKSVFALNVFLYTVFFTVVALYVWTLLDRKVYGYSKYVGFAAFIWRLALTTGTGAIFAFLVARQAYGTALLLPMFIIMSFSFGLAVFMIAQAVMYSWHDQVLDEAVLHRMKNLLATFVAASLYFTVAYHLTNLYFAKQYDFERFILLDGGIYTALFWVGQVLIGSLVPLFILFTSKKSSAVLLASALIILGGLFQLYVFLIGGQAFPLNLFPGMEASSSFFDGRIHTYSPSLPEFLLGMGGVGVAVMITAIGARVLNFMPKDAHH